MGMHGEFIADTFHLENTGKARYEEVNGRFVVIVPAAVQAKPRVTEYLRRNWVGRGLLNGDWTRDCGSGLAAESTAKKIVSDVMAHAAGG